MKRNSVALAVVFVVVFSILFIELWRLDREERRFEAMAREDPSILVIQDDAAHSRNRCEVGKVRAVTPIPFDHHLVWVDVGQENRGTTLLWGIVAGAKPERGDRVALRDVEWNRHPDSHLPGPGHVRIASKFHTCVE